MKRNAKQEEETESLEPKVEVGGSVADVFTSLKQPGSTMIK